MSLSETFGKDSSDFLRLKSFSKAPSSKNEDQDESLGSGCTESDGSPSAASEPSIHNDPFEIAANDSDDSLSAVTEHRLTSEQADAVPVAIVRSKDSTAEPEANKTLDELRQIRYWHLLGDYAGRFWKSLRKAARAINQKLPDSVVVMRENLVVEGHTGPGPWTETIDGCLKYLRQDGYTVDLDMARLAIDIYADRNLTCHSKVGSREIARNRPARDRAFDEDLAKLDDLLGGKRVSDRKTLRQLMLFYQDTQTGRENSPDDEVYHRVDPQQLPEPAETSNSFDSRGIRNESPVKSRPVSPSSRTVPKKLCG